MIEQTQFGAIILCGGMSKRMGTPKAWLPFGNETMLQRVVRVVATVANPVVVVAAAGQTLPQLPDNVTILRDEQPEQGPLQGVLLGLKHLEGDADFAFLTGCDLPLLQSAYIQRMRELAIDNGLTLPKVEGRTHPLPSVIAVSLWPVLQTLFDAGERRMWALFEQLPCRLITEDEIADIGLSSLYNLNRPIDYERALRLLEDGNDLADDEFP